VNLFVILPLTSFEALIPLSVLDPLSLPSLKACSVAVIGLGYVGLPLAVTFGTPGVCRRSGQLLKRRVIGFDINQRRLSQLQQGLDSTHESSAEELLGATQLILTSDPALLADVEVFIVTVPTPIDSAKRPDLAPLERASANVGKALRARAKAGVSTLAVVIFESTVYPGVTEDVCVPILERESGLQFNQDFVCGYSPERVNPGDREHRLTSIVKVTSGSTVEAAAWIDDFYGSIIAAGTHPASSIKVAEAAKVIENTQRDLNIALVNELAMIFRRMGIDTLDVLAAAGSKWNFLPFKPGLVGGHCIGVDPYYLTHKAEQLGYHPQVVLAGRRINDGMGEWVVQQLVLAMARAHRPIGGARVLVLGLSFKENCPDLRNTRVIDVIHALVGYGMEVVVVDPWVDPDEAQRDYNLCVQATLPQPGQAFDAVIAAVAHRQFAELDPGCWQQLLGSSALVFDLKGIVPRELATLRL
jgi:UDP-N-acetyl-D-galactosamine dehydrogenase